MSPQFEVLDWLETPLGPLLLRRRELLGRPGVVVTEVTLDHELLMSSLHTASEVALAEVARALHGGAPARVLVGGLGLGYTAAAALDGGAEVVRVVDKLPAVIDWLQRGLLPLSERLNSHPGLEVVEDDVYALLLGEPREVWDLILVDVDHTPTERLGPGSEPFYTPAGLRRVAGHLAPGGVLAVWSAGDDEDCARAMSEVFPTATRERVRWRNDLIDDGEEIEDVVFLGRRGGD